MQTNPEPEPHFAVVSHFGFAEIRKDLASEQQSLFALQLFEEGSLISPFGAAFTTNKPSYLTVQVGHRKHIALHPSFLQYINHSCDPNCFFDTTSMQVVALREIRAGEEFTFFYPSTEWQMDSPFECYCKQPGCLGLIRGAAHIPEAILVKYRLSDFIKSQVQLQNRDKKIA